MEKEVKKDKVKVRVMCGDYTIWYKDGVYKAYDNAYPETEEMCFFEGNDRESLLFALDMRKTEFIRKHYPRYNIYTLPYSLTEYYNNDMFDSDKFRRITTANNNDYEVIQELFNTLLESMKVMAEI